MHAGLAAATVGADQSNSWLESAGVIGQILTPTTQAVARAKHRISRFPEVQLNGSQSASFDGEDLDYKWDSIGGRASLDYPNISSPIATFKRGPGRYVFRLTVTDDAGNTSTDRVTILYEGRRNRN